MKKQNQTQEEFELIERYLTGSMGQEEQSIFEESLKKDNRLSQQVEEVRVLLTAVEEQSFRYKLDIFHEEINSRQGDSKLSNPIKKTVYTYKKYAIAASLALLMGFGYWMLFGQISKDEKLFNKYFIPDLGLITPMSTTSDYEFYRGMVDYKQGNYELAIKRWSRLIEQKPNNDTLNYFLGISYLSQNENKKAIAFLTKTTQNPNSIFINETWHYLGLIHLKEGNSDDAIKSFEKSNLENSWLILKETRQTE